MGSAKTKPPAHRGAADTRESVDSKAEAFAAVVRPWIRYVG